MKTSKWKSRHSSRVACTLVNAYAPTAGGKWKAVTSALRHDFGQGTIATMVDGIKTLAML